MEIDESVEDAVLDKAMRKEFADYLENEDELLDLDIDKEIENSVWEAKREVWIKEKLNRIGLCVGKLLYFIAHGRKG